MYELFIQLLRRRTSAFAKVVSRNHNPIRVPIFTLFGAPFPTTGCRFLGPDG